MPTLQECIDEFKAKITRHSFAEANHEYNQLRFGAKLRYKDVLRITREKYPDLEESEFEDLLETLDD